MKKNLLITAVILLTSSLMGCSKEGNTSANSKEGSAVTTVTVAEVQEMAYATRLTYPGTLEPNRSVHLSAAIPGRVEKLFYRKGDFVPSGATIAVLSDEMLIQAEVEYNTLKKDYERLERLKEKGSVSVVDHDHLKAKFEASEAKVAMLKKNTTITAPFGGVLVDIMVEEGENFSMVPSVSTDLEVKSGIVQLMQLNPLKVTFEVNEKELPLIERGNEVEVTFDAYPNDTVVGKIAAIAPVLSARTHTTTIEAQIPNPQLKYKPGMYCNTSIRQATAQGRFVPLNAIYRQGGNSTRYLFVLNNDDTVSKVAISDPVVYGDKVRVNELQPGQKVVVDGKNALVDGAKVKVLKK